LPKEEETPPLEFPFEIKDNLFIHFGNTSKYPLQQKPSTTCHHPLDPPDEEFCQKNPKELTTIRRYFGLTISPHGFHAKYEEMI
jgi:hypothetical protein